MLPATNRGEPFAEGSQIAHEVEQQAKLKNENAGPELEVIRSVAGAEKPK